MSGSVEVVPVLFVALAAAGCASSHRRPQGHPLPAELVREARSIGRGVRFQPPATGEILGRCTRRLGRRVGVHVEVLAANQVVIVASGIGTRPPRGHWEGRISTAHFYGDLVTLEPTGVVLVRPRAGLVLSDLFRSWGHRLS
jgi:hypothetical protein